MTRFRYQVVIHVGEQTTAAAPVAWLEYQQVTKERTGIDLELDISRRKAWSEYANNPLQTKFARYLIPQLRNALAEQLPDYMCLHRSWCSTSGRSRPAERLTCMHCLHLTVRSYKGGTVGRSAHARRADVSFDMV
jgi:hypothetical protein